MQPGSPTQTSQYFQIAAWVVASVGGTVAAVKAIQEMRLSREQRVREFAWARAKEATALLKELDALPAARAACLMLDWQSRQYVLPSGKVALITQEHVWRALRTRGLQFTATDAYIRDAFDSLFSYFEQVERAVRAGLVDAQDVEPALGYYVEIMAYQRAPFRDFMEQYGYKAALAFSERIYAWRIPSPAGVYVDAEGSGKEGAGEGSEEGDG